MNLVCFPHYTAGGLLCEILNSSESSIGKNGGFTNDLHSIGKIGDSDSIFDEYNVNELYEKLENSDLKNNDWIGTHCWPGKLDLTKFNKIINITTVTYRSKLFRWARAYELYFKNSEDFTKLSESEKLVKIKVIVQNYIKPFLPIHGVNTINIEFSSIVDCDLYAKQLINDNNRYNLWKTHNDFLYNSTLWNLDIAKWFNEAEYNSVINA